MSSQVTATKLNETARNKTVQHDDCKTINVTP